MRTYLCQIESILNKRTLTPISEEFKEFEAITLNHPLKDCLNDKNSFGSFTHYIKVSQNHCKTVHSHANIF